LLIVSVTSEKIKVALEVTNARQSFKIYARNSVFVFIPLVSTVERNDFPCKYISLAKISRFCKNRCDRQAEKEAQD